jgi:hypothetical protein
MRPCGTWTFADERVEVRMKGGSVDEGWQCG